MKRTTIMIIPDGAHSTRQIQLPRAVISGALVASLGLFSLFGYFVVDYMQLRAVRNTFQTVATENKGLKGEARILMQNLQDVKRSLKQVDHYTDKLGKLTQIKVDKVSQKTGIGPLSEEEYKTAKTLQQKASLDYIPTGVNLDSLVFRPVFKKLASIGQEADQHALKLQRLLSTLSQQKSLLTSIPSVSPVNGWITSGFGSRVSPFTGDKSMHRGLDVAAPVGTPIHAPADGVVIFSGKKSGFGNFVMVAHGYGIVSRYGHNHQNMVQPGQKVSRGDQLATVGMTGRTTGSHLHYEVWVNGRAQNPKKFILDMNDVNLY